MDTTPNLNLPFILAAQAQKHVTHNEALRSLDAIVQIGIIDRDITDPPASPNEGDRYIVAPAAIGAWIGQDLRIAAWQDGAWMFYAPQDGWLAWISDENQLFAWDGTSWIVAGGGGAATVNPTPLVGINATADEFNRLSISAPATLFNNAGYGHQLKINKNSDTDTASILFQTGFSGRAEFGLTGDDDFHMKVSPDGSMFHDAIIINQNNGEVTFPNTTIGSETRKAVRIRDTTSQSVPANTTVQLSYNTVDYDTDGFFDPATPDRVTIPTGVSVVNVWLSANLIPDNILSEYCVFFLRLFDSGGVQKNLIAPSNQNTNIVVNTGPFAVDANDYFIIQIHHKGASDKTTQATSTNFMALEVIA